MAQQARLGAILTRATRIDLDLALRTDKADAPWPCQLSDSDSLTPATPTALVAPRRARTRAMVSADGRHPGGFCRPALDRRDTSRLSRPVRRGVRIGGDGGVLTCCRLCPCTARVQRVADLPPMLLWPVVLVRFRKGKPVLNQMHFEGSTTARLWAKTGDQQTWHSLCAHLVDTALVARQLWSDWLAPATRRWLAEPLGGDEAATGRFFSLLAGCHDLGKASPAFQCQVDWLAEGLTAAGLPLGRKLPARRKAPHSLVSAATIVPILESRGWCAKSIQGVAAILGGHHGWFPPEGYASEPMKRPELYGSSLGSDDPWIAARRELFDLVAEASGAQAVLHDMALVDLGRARELALAGYVVLADWIASNASLFPYASSPFERSYLEQAGRHAEAALDDIGWRRWRVPSPTRGRSWFSDRFGFPPNELQCLTIEVAATQAQPGLLLIEAPMGLGKTEASLAAAEVIAANHGLEGVFLGLPTQATSNQMFHRTRRWLEHMGSGTFVLELAHGKARQLAEYRRLLDHGAPTCIDVDGEKDAFVTAEAWFAGPKRRLLAPFVVGTVDQVLMCSAKVRHVALRQIGLAGKVVIIDEVHAYDAHMSVFLRRTLRWLGASGTPVVLLTATLPPATRARLAEAYVGRSVYIGDVAYPSVTSVSPDGTSTSSPVTTASPPLCFEMERLDEPPLDGTCQALRERVVRLAARGANVLVIRNTVARAQQAFLAVVAEHGAASVTLLHSRFTAADRLAKERWLTERFGPGAERPSGQIVIGTQVLEQSLDVDFDVLVTDLAPIDLVLQRMGRVHRHRGVTRPAGFEEPFVVLAGALRAQGAPPRFPPGSLSVYGEHLLLRSAAVLEELAEIVLPRDVPGLVATVYGGAAVVPTAWLDRARSAEAEWSSAQHRRECRAEEFAIPPPEVAPNLLELCRIGLDDPDDDDPAVQAAVRDSPVSIEVVLGFPGEKGGYVRCGVEMVPLETRPSPTEADAVLSATLHLPAWLTGAALDLEVPEGWKAHPWLRNERLLRLTRDGEAQIGHDRVRYSEARGLEVDRRGR